MRQRAGGLNRTWLFIVGLILLLGALAGGLTASGRLDRAGATVGLGLPSIRGGDAVFGGADPVSAMQEPIGSVIATIAGLVLIVLGVWWALAQVPRKNEARPLRFEADPDRGLTTCEPRVICAAGEDDAAGVEGVNAVSAVLRGTTAAPELTLKVTASDRTDLARLLDELGSGVAGRLTTALDAPLAHLGVQLEVDHSRRSATRVVL
jgi:hypothetical protein